MVQVFNYDELESTQIKARELLATEQLPFLVTAKTQSSGKGTQGRIWFSPEGGLYSSLVLRLPYNILEGDAAARCAELSLAAANLLKDFLQDYFSSSLLEDLQVKPINDLYFQDSKLAGILIETVNNLEQSILILGLGLNIKKLDSSKILDRKVISLEEILDQDLLLAEDFLEKLSLKLLEIEGF